MLNGELLICVGLSASLLAPARPTGGAAEVAKLTEDFIRAPDLFCAREEFNALFKRVGVEGLKQLRSNAHDSIALQAAWREVRLTLPEKEGVRRVRPDAAKLRWFLGFLEGRGRLRIPDWWQQTLLGARTFSRDDCLNLPLGQSIADQMRDRLDRGTLQELADDEPPIKPFYHDSGFRNIKTPLDTTLKEEAGSIVVSVGKDRTRMASALLSETFRSGFIRWPRNLSALATSSRCHIATHGNFGSYHPLMCIARDSGKMVWKTKVWGHQLNGIIVMDSGSQRVAVTEQGGRVVVFGMSLSGAYVEAFDAKDGKNLFRLTTGY